MGEARQSHAEEQQYKPNGDATSKSHGSGYIGELVFSKYLGVPMPSDWTWAGDKRRGYDVGGWQVRTSFSPKTGMLMRHKTDKPGYYAHIITCYNPMFWIVGYATLDWAKQYWVDGVTPGRNPQPCKYVPIDKLLPLPDIGGSFVVKEVEYEQAA